jgi:hypothetical protein
MRIVSVTSFAAAVLAFTLPFGLVTSCDGGEVRFTGVELATYTVPADPLDSSDRDLRDTLEKNAGAFALAALLTAVVGLALAALGIRGVPASAALGVLLMQLVLYGVVLTGDESSSLFVGFWLSLGAFVTAGVTALVGAVRARRRTARSAWPPVGWAVAVVLPPIGAAIACIVAFGVFVVRWMRRTLAAGRASPSP